MCSFNDLINQKAIRQDAMMIDFFDFSHFDLAVKKLFEAIHLENFDL